MNVINPYLFAAAGNTDPYFSSVVLLAHFDGTNGATTTTDSSSYARTITLNSGAALSTTSPKFGTASLLTDGADDYGSCAASTDFSFGTGTDFTVEFWLKSDGGKDQPFVTLLRLIEHAPDVAEAAVKLARFKLSQ